MAPSTRLATSIAARSCDPLAAYGPARIGHCFPFWCRSTSARRRATTLPASSTTRRRRRWPRPLTVSALSRKSRRLGNRARLGHVSRIAQLHLQTCRMPFVPANRASRTATARSLATGAVRVSGVADRQERAGKGGMRKIKGERPKPLSRSTLRNLRNSRISSDSSPKRDVQCTALLPFVGRAWDSIDGFSTPTAAALVARPSLAD